VSGFGWNFYGFFLFCFIWIAGYFLWARAAARRDERLRPERSAGGEPAEGRPPSESERGSGPASAKR
jgi:hypothetical protein